MNVRDFKASLPDAIFLPEEIDKAIMGTVEKDGLVCPVYDKEKAIALIMEAKKWSRENAIAFVKAEANQASVYMGDMAPFLFVPRDVSDQPAKLKVWVDECASDLNPLNPEDGCDWKLVSFNSRHRNYENPDQYWVQTEDEDAFMARFESWSERIAELTVSANPLELVRINRDNPKPKPEMGWREDIRKKLDDGTAFLLSYFEHGNCAWFRKDSRNMPDMRWDGVSLAGILLLPDDWKPYAPEGEEPPTREKCVDEALEEYTDWCNGNVYGFTIEAEDGTNIDSCGGFIGSKWLNQHLREEHPELFDKDGKLNEGIEVNDEYSVLE